MIQNPLVDYPTIISLQKEMARLGYTHEPVTIEDRSYSRFTAPNRQEWFTSDANIYYPFMTNTARLIANHKHLSYELAEKSGVVIPFTHLIQSGKITSSTCKKLLAHAPLVVKPNNSTLARGVTLNIESEEALRAAIDDAKVFSEDVLCQAQIGGEEIRILVVDGKAVVTLLRRSPAVTGDGKQTLKQLIADENRKRKKLKFRRGGYPQLDVSIISVDEKALASIPGAGKVIVLRHTAMIRYGASVYNITREIHPSYLRKAEKLADALGRGLVAVDLFVSEYKAPATEQNYAFIEFNMSPILGLCYCCRDSERYDIIRDVSTLIDRHLASAYRRDNTLGCFEVVSLPELGIEQLAKIDTGAYSGALHCTDIKVVRRGLARRQVLKFVPFGDQALATETDQFLKRYVRSASGHRTVRYVVQTTITIRNKTYPISIGLADRSDLKTPVLIGRRFLRENDLLVDVRLNQEQDDERETLQ